MSYASHVIEYIREELQFGDMIGPFDHTFHISHLMTSDKVNFDTRRIIMDLSWPKGQGVSDAVNTGMYLGTQFEMHYPTVDKIVRQLIR